MSRRDEVSLNIVEAERKCPFDSKIIIEKGILMLFHHFTTEFFREI